MGKPVGAESRCDGICSNLYREGWQSCHSPQGERRFGEKGVDVASSSAALPITAIPCPAAPVSRPGSSGGTPLPCTPCLRPPRRAFMRESLVSLRRMGDDRYAKLRPYLKACSRNLRGKRLVNILGLERTSNQLMPATTSAQQRVGGCLHGAVSPSSVIQGQCPLGHAAIASPCATRSLGVLEGVRTWANQRGREGAHFGAGVVPLVETERIKLVDIERRESVVRHPGARPL